VAFARSRTTELESCSSAADWISSRSYSATESPEEPKKPSLAFHWGVNQGGLLHIAKVRA
jgi:hypothetical protein